MQTPLFPVNLDLRRGAGAFPKYWSRCFGSEHAGYWLRRDLLEHHRLGRHEFGNEFVRFHGALSEPVGVASRDRRGKLQHHWFNLEKVYDNVLDLGLRPFVELSFMPAALASGKKTIFYWKGNVCMPRRLSEWEELIEAMLRRLARRYGISELRRWYWEVWNEPNLPKWFFHGTMKDYFRLYDHAATAIKRVDKGLRVGGPATACAGWIEEFINHCRRENYARPSAGSTPVDFASYHLYPTDPFFMQKEGMDFQWMGEEFFRGHIHRNHDIVRSHADLGLEIHMTEWNCSSNSRDPIHDLPAGAAFAVKAVQEVAGKVDTFSWWTLTDLFEEAGLPPAAFHGGFGLMSVDGLKKPSWFAFELMNRLGEELLSRPLETGGHAAGCIPTRHWDSSARLLFWNFRFPGGPKAPARRVKGRIAGFPASRRTALLERWLIDERHSNILPHWKALGSPQSLNAGELHALKAKNTLARAESRVVNLKKGVAEFGFRLDPDSVSLLTLR